MVTRGERDGGGINERFGISRFKLIYMKQVNNKLLLHSSRKYIYIYAHTNRERDSAVHQKLTQYCKSTILQFLKMNINIDILI